jgi:hypothetical protein
MAIFKYNSEKLQPLRRLSAETGLKESQIELIVWENLSDVCGEQLFPVTRQARINGGIPDIVAIDQFGRVVVIEIKRGVERSQLAQVLEYAAWATSATLEEIANLYHFGRENFWNDWQDFTSTETPLSINQDPRMILIAEGYDVRTRQAIEFLAKNKMRLSMISVSLYEDESSNRFLDVQGIKEPLLEEVEGVPQGNGYQSRMAWGISLSELLDAGLLEPGEKLEWIRPRKGDEFHAQLLETGDIQIEDGRIFRSSSAAAASAANIVAANGWVAWRVPRLGAGVTLADVQQILGKARFSNDS